VSKKFISISHDQRKKIYALVKSAGLSNEQLHEYIVDWAGTNSLSSTKCSLDQADKIIKALQKITGDNIHTFRPSRESGNQQGDEATYEQLTCIAELQKSLGWNDARISGFIRHTAKVNTIGELTVALATKVITGLKKMEYTKNQKSNNKYENQNSKVKNAALL